MLTFLQEAWELYRRNFAAILTLALPVWIPCLVYETWKKDVPLPAGSLANTLRQEIPVTLLLSILATAAVYYYLGAASAGRPVELVAAAKASLEFWSRMFITRFIVGIVLVVGFILLVIPGIYLSVRLGLCEQIVLAEEIAGIDAMRRSWELTAGKFWRVFGWMVVGSLPPFALSVLIFLPFAFLHDFQNGPMQALGLCVAMIPMTFLFPVYWLICDRLRQEDAATF